MTEINDCLLVKIVEEGGQIPTRGSAEAAGFDLKTNTNAILPPKSLSRVSTGISFRVPQGTYGRIAPRSGLVYKKNVTIDAGVIDRDYTGVVHVLMRNWSDESVFIKEGDRIAQLIIEKIEIPQIIQTDSLDTTERNDGGFGSTGL